MRKIGLIGGGQLGRMAIEEARKYLAEIEVLSPDYPSPAADVADATHLGDPADREAVLEFAEGVDAVSYEIESANVDALRELERGGKTVLPSAGVLAALRDKAAQKAMLDAAGVPTARWEALPGEGAPSPEALAAAAARLGGFPAVQKARFGGYDGRGVRVLDSEAAGALAGPSLLEERIDFAKELAVVAARSPDGNFAAYPCAEMVFDPRANLCDSVLAPAREGPAVLERAGLVALDALRALDAEATRLGSPAGGCAGVFAVELFLARDGRILVNEIAPRPHNSGHWTIEACATSQFDQYLRILLGLPLGSPETMARAMMVNLIGEPGAAGVPEYRGLERALAVPGVSVHLYGKREVRPFRKMGHLTAVGRTHAEAIERAERARALVRVAGRG